MSDKPKTYYGAPTPLSTGPHPDPLAKMHCADCCFFHKGYRLQRMRVPSFCNHHFHSVAHDDPACAQFGVKDVP